MGAFFQIMAPKLSVSRCGYRSTSNWITTYLLRGGNSFSKRISCYLFTLAHFLLQFSPSAAHLSSNRVNSPSIIAVYMPLLVYIYSSPPESSRYQLALKYNNGLRIFLPSLTPTAAAAAECAFKNGCC